MVLMYAVPDPLIGANLAAEVAAALGLPAPTDPLTGDVRVEVVGDSLLVVVPDGSDEQVVATVVAAHTGQPTTDQVDAALSQSTGLTLSAAEYRAVRAQLANLRTLRQMGRSAFMAQTEAERSRQLYDALTAVTRVLIAVLRDPEG